MSGCGTISKVELTELIECDLEDLPIDLQRIWDRIQIEAHKVPMNGSECGADQFWVVAKCEDKVVWYNDIEEGFNFCTLNATGELEPGFEQWSLGEVLQQLSYSFRSSKKFSQ